MSRFSAKVGGHGDFYVSLKHVFAAHDSASCSVVNSGDGRLAAHGGTGADVVAVGRLEERADVVDPSKVATVTLNQPARVITMAGRP
jgi:hypothetical protein